MKFNFLSSFSSQLKFLFLVISFFTVVQSAITIWSYSESKFQSEKIRISNKILAEFIDIGGNKQRLKVWLAQSLLTKDSPVEFKNELFEKIEHSLNSLRTLLEEEKKYSKDSKEFQDIEKQIQYLKTLEINILSLKFEFKSLNPEIAKKSNSEIWKYLIDVFDKLEGRDLKRLLDEAITLQKTRTQKAEQNSIEFLSYLDNFVYAITILFVFASLILIFLIVKNMQRPLNQLKSATLAMLNGELNHRIHPLDDSEFGELGRSFNQMADTIEKSKIQEFNNRERIEKKVEERTLELQAAINQLKKNEEEKKIFLSNISHELRTPATAIIGEAEVTLRQKQIDIESFKETLSHILTTARQLSLRIEDLLALANSDNKHLNLNLSAINLTKLEFIIQQAQHLIPSYNKNRIKLLSNSMNISFLADEKRLTQIFVIIFDNAIRYSKLDSDINVIFQVDSYFSKILIQSNPYFIDEIDISKLFNRYYRSEKSKSLKPDGLGIGLFIAKQIMQSHDGYITAKIENNLFQIELIFESLEAKSNE